MEKVLALKNRFVRCINENRYMLLLSLFLGLVITLGAGLYTKAYSEKTQQRIAEEVIRFHVLANSDDDVDQELKLKVRDGILDTFQAELNASKSIEETRGLLLNNLDGIQARAEEIVQTEGYDYTVSVHLSRDMFPTKNYANVKLPAGEYEALRVVLGEGQGQNWWCVMFPPLCFVDVTKGEVSEEVKEEMKGIFTEEEYRLMTESDEALPIKVKFKVVEWWQERKDPESFALIDASDIITDER